MAINLHTKYSDKIQSIFVNNSYIKGMLDSTYKFSGVKSVIITIPQTIPMVDYVRNGTNRYGTPTEMQDTIQEMVMSQDKSFALTIDKGNNEDQSGTKNAGKMLALQLAERAVPLMDTYVFGRLGTLAGTTVANTKPTKTSICDLISDGTEILDDAEIPQEGRVLFVNSENYKFLKHSPEFLGVDSLGEKALAKGQVGEYDNMKVIKVPSSRFPVGLQFLIVHKRCATAPVKIDDTKLHTDPPGISGNLLEGRQYYDCFIYEPKAIGIYAYYDGSVATKTAAPTISASTGAITGASGATFYYTLDGSDPRYSANVLVGAAPTVASGDTVRAYASVNGQLISNVTTQVIA